MGGHQTILETLLAANPSLVHEKDQFGYTAAWWAERRGHKAIATWLSGLEETSTDSQVPPAEPDMSAVPAETPPSAVAADAPPASNVPEAAPASEPSAPKPSSRSVLGSMFSKRRASKKPEV